MTVSAGGNDVGFSNVLKKCVYLTGSEPGCDEAIDSASRAIDTQLRKNIKDLLDVVLPVLKNNDVVVYTLYGKFFNETTTACNKHSWTLLDLTGSNGYYFGLKLTSERRHKMNMMVDSANKEIGTVIESARSSFETNKISLQVTDWDEYVGLTQGRFCEEGAPQDPEEDRKLAFQRKNQRPQFIPPEKLLVGNTSSPDSVSRALDDLSVEPLERPVPILPDYMTRVFHPNFLGQSIIAQITLMKIASAKAEKLHTDRYSESCTLYPAEPECKEDLRAVISHPKYDGAVLDFCRNVTKSMVTTIEGKTLELGFSEFGTAICHPTDCAQSIYNLYEAGEFNAASTHAQ